MRAVVDNNVWVSAALNPSGSPGQVLAAFRTGQFILVTSDPLLEELTEIFSRPRLAQRGVPPEAFSRVLALLRSGAELVSVKERFHSLCRDPDDDVVIETAVQGRAEVVVSGDHDLVQAIEVAEYLSGAGIRVLTVRQFLQELNDP